MNESPAQVLETLTSERHSCRAFLPQPVDRATLESVLRMAQRAASWCNSQAWQVSVLSGAATERLREKLVAAARAGEGGATDFPFPHDYQGVYLERRRDCGFRLYGAVGVERGDRGGYAQQTLENFRLFGAPHVAILTSDAGLGVYGAVDVGGYVQLVLLAMQAHGIAAIPQAALAHHGALIKRELGIGPDRLMVCGISFGYEDTAHPANGFRTPRAPLAQAVQFVDA
ncbi:nitroreductase [Xenophilus arseniciresistens]|uniref:Nitroreductase n=1 Tax=Xenophilus arseniciresistens TaxID=1283306 RepID=A0AAE3NDS5_9BURK|nr:nitroreductase [Xenophilus arseniciresistens]MDA7418991.1 nitroreductase [Xenophilus arseniciresistens]